MTKQRKMIGTLKKKEKTFPESISYNDFTYFFAFFVKVCNLKDPKMNERESHEAYNNRPDAIQTLKSIKGRWVVDHLNGEGERLGLGKRSYKGA